MQGAKTTPESVARWTAALGEMIAHIHHYCNGLLAMNRAQRFYSVSAQHRQHNWRAAINEISYVIRRASDDYVLLPEFLYRRGFAAVRVGDDRLAAEDFQRALRLHPSYFPAAAELAKLQARHGRLDLAEATVATGLQHSPDAASLLDLKREFERTATNNSTRGTKARAAQSEEGEEGGGGEKSAAAEDAHKPKAE